ncbi:MAG: hypothetical protein J6Y20_07770 [Lachnospiraceae bacterium]|nr:hypothetical protein [Lachnospiraceae bacterium]
MDSQRIMIRLPNGFYLVAEASADPNYPYEVYVGIVGNDGVWYQDLAIVRNAYHYEDDIVDVNGIPIPVNEEDRFEVLVYADENNEDYTNAFKIEMYHGGI